MNDPILFADVEALVTDFLTEVLDVTVSSEVPPTQTLDDEHLQVFRTGGPRRNLVTDEPQLSIEARAATPKAAHDLAQLARAHLHALVGTTLDGLAVYRVDELSGPQALPDPNSAQPRYVFTVTVALRGTTVTGS